MKTSPLFPECKLQSCQLCRHSNEYIAEEEIAFHHRTWDNNCRPGILILHKDELEAYRYLWCAQKLGFISICQYIDCNSKHMLIAKGSDCVTSVTNTLETDPIDSQFYCTGQCWSEKDKHMCISRPSPCTQPVLQIYHKKPEMPFWFYRWAIESFAP